MRHVSLMLLLAAIGVPAHAAEPDAATVPVALSNFDFTPSSLHLRAGAPVVLHLENTGRGGHSFGAPEFFAAANVDQESLARIKKGVVEVPGGSSIDVKLVPSAGHYSLRCTHTLHSTFGMRGEIVVD